MKQLTLYGVFLLTLLLACGTESGTTTTDPAPRTPGSLGREGNATDAVVSGYLPGTMLMGGSTDVDAAIAWMADRAAGGDFLVLRVTGGSGYNSYIKDLGTLNSVETLRLDTDALARDSAVVRAIRNAEALFIAGGDQYDYIRLWKDTPVEEAIRYLLLTKKVPVGGTSAGCAILGQFSFTAQNGTVTSSQALSNPFSSLVALNAGGFLEPQFLAATITDSHYDNPDRRGRHMAFLARLMNQTGAAVKGIGLEERTAICIDGAGLSTVFGIGRAYFLEATPAKAPETLVSGSPLTWNQGGQAVLSQFIEGTPTGVAGPNLSNWTGFAGATSAYWSVQAGVFQED